ncbi:MAG: hypothetical protein ACFCU3_08760 [Verrucomicrobiales bacterium]
MSLPPKDCTASSLSEIAGLAIGVGIGLLVGDRFRRGLSKTLTSAALVTAGVASSMPFVVKFVRQQFLGPGTSRNAQKTLERIREDSGIQHEAQGF